MKSIVVCLFLQTSMLVYGQELQELRHFTTSGYSSDFYIALDDKRIKYADTLDYYWFKSQQVHVTQGYSAGNLLNGPYTKFYVSGQLAESGQFEMGLQTGEWKTWYESGQLRSIYNYDKGVADGNYFRYDESGQLVESGNFRSGKYHGEKIENGEVTKYRNGKEKRKKVKEEEEKADQEEDDEPKELKADKENKFWSKFFSKEEDQDPEEQKDKEKKKKKDRSGNNENKRRNKE